MGKNSRFVEFTFGMLKLERSFRESNMFKQIESQFNDSKAIFSINAQTYSNVTIRISISYAVKYEKIDIYNIGAEVEVAGNIRTFNIESMYMPETFESVVELLR